MDWGLLSCNKDGSLYVRHRTLLPLPLYAIVTVINLLLRFSWAANRITFFESLHPSMLVLVIELGEVLRRSIWFIFRIEWEVISIAERQANKNDSETLLVKK